MQNSAILQTDVMLDSAAERRRIWRNLLLYTVGVMTLSVLGGAMLSTGTGIGGLIFISGPILMVILLRALGGDGWQDAGLRLGSLPWYLFALLLFPGTLGLILGIGVVTGTILFRGSVGALAGAAVTGLVPALLFAMFEEWGWRGYLEPRLARLGIPDLRRHLLVGMIWAVWHIPYFWATPGFITLPPALYALLMVGGFLAMAVVHGQLRKVSGTVWTVVLAHGLGNAIAQPLLGGMAESRLPALIDTRFENLFFIVLWTVIGWWLIRRKP
ncbi:MAG: CPBP family intramembrane metalloprotease [Caldilineaceae bacterium]|nr:CPBP family intramembrane metalloprotease [Caldilineaceae bacterium]